MSEPTPDAAQAELITEAKIRLVQARAYIASKAPYFYDTIVRFVTEWTPGFGTLGVTPGLVCIIDPDFWVNRVTSDKLRASCLAHEAMHILSDMDRAQALLRIDEETAQVALDIPINDGLLRHKELWELPTFVCTSHKFGLRPGLPAEAYFELLRQLAKQNPAPKPQQGQQGGRTLGGVPVTGQVGDGSPVAGQPSRSSPVEAKALAERLDRAKGRTPSEVAQIRREGIRAMAKAAQGSKLRGNLPDYLQVFVNWQEVEPVIPWVRELRGTLSSTYGRISVGYSDYSMRRPSKRSFTSGIRKPSLVNYEPDIALILDSSGSMGNDQLKTAKAEFVSILRTLGVSRVHYLNADAAVAGQAKYLSLQELIREPIVGRGGTSFIPALEAAKKLRPRPNIVVYATDGDGDAPKNAPKEFEVIWLLVPSYCQRIPAPWGKHIIMSDDRTVRDKFNEKS